MKKVILATLICASALSLTGCNGTTRYMGGEMTVNLDPGQKLVEATWKDDELWYLTRPMRDDENPEVWTLNEKSELGVIEGTVYFVETELGEQ